MNNSIKCRTSKEVSIQLKRAEVQKNILIKNIHKEYEIYFQIVRKSLFTSVEKGIFALYSELFISDSDKSLNPEELNNFLNQNISFFINSKLPFLTIEQLQLGNISNPPIQLANEKHLKELVEIKEYQTFNYDYKNEIITEESFEFHCNNNSNLYEYYELLKEDDFLSVNLDENGDLNSYSKKIVLKMLNTKNIMLIVCLK